MLQFEDIVDTALARMKERQRSGRHIYSNREGCNGKIKVLNNFKGLITTRRESKFQSMFDTQYLLLHLDVSCIAL